MRALTRHFLITGTLAAAVVIAAAVLAPQAAKGDQPSRDLRQCFAGGDIANWRAPDTSTIFLHAANGHYYRLDLARACAPLAWPDARLITRSFGAGMVCSPADLMLSASEDRGFAQPCFVKSMSGPSPDQAAALPKNARP